MYDDEYRALLAIQAVDPDGGEVEPTDRDHEAHREWAIARYGLPLWERYARGGWGITPDV